MNLRANGMLCSEFADLNIAINTLITYEKRKPNHNIISNKPIRGVYRII